MTERANRRGEKTSGQQRSQVKARSRIAPSPDDAAGAKAASGNRRLLTESDVIVGCLVGDARQAAGMPQSHAARQLGWPQSRLGNLELGRRRLLFVEALILADLFRVPLTAFDPRTSTPAPRTGRRARTQTRRDSTHSAGKADARR